MVDFFSKDHWQSVPAEWREPLLSLPDVQLDMLPHLLVPPRMEEKTKVSVSESTSSMDMSTWSQLPESFREFLRTANDLSMPRNIMEVVGPIVNPATRGQEAKKAMEEEEEEQSASNQQTKEPSKEDEPKIAKEHNILPYLNLGVSKKKRNEVRSIP